MKPRPRKKTAARRRARVTTPLQQRLERPARATPQDLHALAHRWWAEGRRFDIGKMAEALGLSRATVFRWVGSRELLYGELLSELFTRAAEESRAQATGEGPALIADVTRRLMTRLVTNQPLRRFVSQDPEFAMRVLMSKSSTVEARSAEVVRRGLEEGVAAGIIQPAIELDALAYLIVRIGESFLYRDVIAGQEPDIEPAITAIQVLLTAR